MPRTTTPAAIFGRWYRDEWADGLPGSTLEYTRHYREFLQEFLRQRMVQSVVDLGCGDWGMMSQLEWTGITCTGIDCVGDLVDRNLQQYGAENIRFVAADICDATFAPPPADLAILKDVLQHLPFRMIIDLVEKVRLTCKHLLVINCSTSDEPRDISVGGFTPLRADRPPLDMFAPEVLFTFQTKQVCLIPGLRDGPSPRPS